MRSKYLPNFKPLGELLRHEFFLIACTDDFTIGNPSDLGCVRVGDLAAANNGDPKHEAPSACNSRSSAEALHSSARFAASQGIASASHSNTGSSSSIRASPSQ